MRDLLKFLLASYVLKHIFKFYNILTKNITNYQLQFTYILDIYIIAKKHMHSLFPDKSPECKIAHIFKHVKLTNRSQNIFIDQVTRMRIV